MYITTCDLTLQENLFYASREMGRLYETEKYLHNYGLSYALGASLSLVTPYFNNNQVPRYQQDLLRVAKEQVIYVTPATPLEFNFAFNTFKLGEANYYSLTERDTVNKVVYGKAKELTAGSRFRFYILSKAALNLPHWVRLGKWMSKAYLAIVDEGDYTPQKPTRPVSIACPLNPLDYATSRLISFDIVRMPPVSLLINAVTSEPCYEVSITPKSGNKSSKDAVYIPAGLAFFGAER